MLKLVINTSLFNLRFIACLVVVFERAFSNGVINVSLIFIANFISARLILDLRVKSLSHCMQSAVRRHMWLPKFSWRLDMV